MAIKQNCNSDQVRPGLVTTFMDWTTFHFYQFTNYSYFKGQNVKH